MSIAANAVAEAPVAAQTPAQARTGRTPVKRKMIAKIDAVSVPEPR